MLEVPVLDNDSKKLENYTQDGESKNSVALNTVSFVTQGCRLNQAESATLARSFEEKSFQVLAANEHADIVVINTCTVTENGDKDARRLVNKAITLNPKVKVALVGCMAQMKQDALLAWPNVQWVVGNAQKMRLASIIAESIEGEALVISPKMKAEAFTEPLQGIDKLHTRANIKIQDGCNFYCSFCVIPFARGPARSRVFSDVTAEAKELVASGHKELVLTGINLGTYAESGKELTDVIDALESIRGLERIRISSIEPTTIPDKLIDQMADKNSKLCAYLHLPIQSGCDATLEAMRRKYSLAEYCEFVQKVTDRVESLCLGTDVIVGFPGETEAHFETTYETLANLPFAYFHVFSYSERQNTRSRKFEDKVSSVEIARRSKLLRELSQRKQIQYAQYFVGKTVKVLVESQKKGQWTGLTEHYLRVNLGEGAFSKHQLVDVVPKRLDGNLLCV